MGGETHKQAVLDVGNELRGGEAHLRPGLPGSPQTIRQRLHELAVEHDYRLGPHRAVLRGAERKDVHARAPRHLGSAASQRHQGVGKSRTVHMEADTGIARAGADGGDLLEGIHRAVFARLCYRHGVRLRTVGDATPGLAQRRRQCRRFELAMGAGKRDELRPAGERFRRAAFGGVDVRFLVAIDGTIGTSAGRKRQGVGRRAGGHRKHRHLGLEQVGELPVQQGAVFVVAIGCSQSAIDGLERAQDLGCDGGHIVAAEIERNGAGTVIHVGHSSRPLQDRRVLATHTPVDQQ